MSVNLENIDKAKDWPVLTNHNGLHSFLGLASYYTRFVPNLTVIAKCLHQLVGLTHVKKTNKKGKKKKQSCQILVDRWTSEVFNLLKDHLTSMQVLGYPELSHLVDMGMDASLHCLSAVLSQRDKNGKSRVITYNRHLCTIMNNLWGIIAQQRWNYLQLNGQYLKIIGLPFVVQVYCLYG